MSRPTRSRNASISLACSRTHSVNRAISLASAHCARAIASYMDSARAIASSALDALASTARLASALARASAHRTPRAISITDADDAAAAASPVYVWSDE